MSARLPAGHRPRPFRERERGAGAGAGGRGAGASAEGQKSTGTENYSTAAERVDPLRRAGGRLREGGEAGGGGLAGGKASVSGFLLGAAAGPRAGGSVSAASPGYFIKEEEKKIKVSGGGDADFL